MLKDINGILLEDVKDAHMATHLIVTNGTTTIRRTPKLMIGMCRTPNIVTLMWLEQSSNHGKPLPADTFLVLDDVKAENQYNFSMIKTIDRVKSNLKEGKYLLEEWSVYTCKGVAGNKAPPEVELKLIVEAAGGKWISSLSGKGMDPKKTIIITSDPEQKKQVNSKDIIAILKKGATKKTSTWLFDAMMTQQLHL